jgi:hypothetical protein
MIDSSRRLDTTDLIEIVVALRAQARRYIESAECRSGDGIPSAEALYRRFAERCTVLADLFGSADSAFVLTLSCQDE